MKITNISKAMQGIWTIDGLKFLDPGQSEGLDIDPAHEESTKRLAGLLSFADPLDHDENGQKGGAKSDANEPATADDITAAIALLDAKDDAHWTAAGLPAVEAVAEIAGKPVTRAAINDAAPDAKRPTE